MTQPTFVPIAEADQVRPARHLHVPGAWTTSRPAELVVPTPGRGRGMGTGTPGPDSGFALRLAKRFEHDLRLDEGESEHDVVLGVALIAAKRAALFGRAPCIYDVRLALEPVGLSRGRPGRAEAGATGRLFGGRARLRRPAGAGRRHPRRDPSAETRRRHGRSRLPLGRGSLDSVTTIGAIDRLEIEAGGLTFTGRACGPHGGRPVLLLHGFPQTSWAWRDELWALAAEGYRAVAPDQRGYCFGRSADGAEAYATERLAGDVLALADSMEMDTLRSRRARLGRHAGLAGGVPAPRSGALVDRRLDPAPAGARASQRPGRRRRRQRRSSARLTSPSGCSWERTVRVAAWPRSWPIPDSTTTTPACTSPPSASPVP